jgi:hypothetical protein
VFIFLEIFEFTEGDELVSQILGSSCSKKYYIHGLSLMKISYAPYGSVSYTEEVIRDLFYEDFYRFFIITHSCEREDD